MSEREALQREADALSIDLSGVKDTRVIEDPHESLFKSYPQAGPFRVADGHSVSVYDTKAGVTVWNNESGYVQMRSRAPFEDVVALLRRDAAKA